MYLSTVLDFLLIEIQGVKNLSIYIIDDNRKDKVTNRYVIIFKQELKEYRTGLFFTKDGEVFDCRNKVPTFRNIKLRKYPKK